MVDDLCVPIFGQRCRRYNGADGTEAVQLENFYIDTVTQTVKSFGCTFCRRDRCYAAIDGGGNVVMNDTVDDSDLSSCTYTNRHLDKDAVGASFLKKTQIDKKTKQHETRPLTIVYPTGTENEKTAGSEEYRDIISA